MASCHGRESSNLELKLSDLASENFFATTLCRYKVEVGNCPSL